jgi:cytidyltransferase-like protein
MSNTCLLKYRKQSKSSNPSSSGPKLPGGPAQNLAVPRPWCVRFVPCEKQLSQRFDEQLDRHLLIPHLYPAAVFVTLKALSDHLVSPSSFLTCRPIDCRSLPTDRYCNDNATAMQETVDAPNGANAPDYSAQSCSQSGIISDAMIPLHRFLLAIGLPSDRLPSAEAVTYSTIVIVVSAIAYMFHAQRRKRLSRELQDAHAKLHYLQEKIFNSGKTKEKEVRIFIDGAFDVLHYGHMNAFRLGRSLGTQLVVGVNSDDSITTCKGPPLMNDQERLTMVSACKFVDEVVPGVPYIMNREYLEYVIEKYNIDFVVHGDDPCIVDGKDVYATAKQAGKFRTIPRTEGVSTTDIVGRMLLMTKEHHYHNSDGTLDGTSKATPATEWLGHQSKFLTTSRMLQLFSAGVQAPTKEMRVVYVDGAWDLFHPGHAAMLKVAREVRLRGVGFGRSAS